MSRFDRCQARPIWSGGTGVCRARRPGGLGAHQPTRGGGFAGYVSELSVLGGGGDYHFFRLTEPLRQARIGWESNAPAEHSRIGHGELHSGFHGDPRLVSIRGTILGEV